MTALIVCLLIYLVSGFLTWLYINIEYSEKGVFSASKPDMLDFLFVVCPMINTAHSLFWIFDSPYKAEYRKISVKFLKWFFVTKSKNPK